MGENDLTARRFVQSFGLTYPVLRDPVNTVYSAYSISGITPFPRDCIIDPNGVVQYLHSEYDPHSMWETLSNIIVTGNNGSEPTNTIPNSFHLGVFPNPTNSAVTIEYTIPDESFIKLHLYDINGKQIFSKNITSGRTGDRVNYFLNLSGQASGIYFITMSASQIKESQKIVLVR